MNTETFSAAMKAEHGSKFAQMPDLLAFRPNRAEKDDDGFDVYGCGKARREGNSFNGVAVVHAVLQDDAWFFSGWAFTAFPNEPCKTLSNANWTPPPPMEWNKAMDEVTQFVSNKSQ